MMKKRDGSAMIIVMCIMVMTTVLSLALLLSASVMVKNSVRSNQKEQCRIGAVSMADVIKAQIISFKYNGDEKPNKDANATPSLRNKLQTVATRAWLYYNPDAKGVNALIRDGKQRFRYKLTSDVSPLPGDFYVDMYFLDERGDTDRWDPAKVEDQDPNEIFGHVVLYVEVTNTVGEESCTIVNTFSPVVNMNNDSTDWKEWYWIDKGRTWEKGDS